MVFNRDFNLRRPNKPPPGSEPRPTFCLSQRRMRSDAPADVANRASVQACGRPRPIL